tara:strand:+ start:595 stop:846 length:252 start_codon:yes stop_codon:yes gene_type:complete
MSIFNLEYKEDRESLFEANKFSPETEKKLFEAMKNKKETFPDVVQCPNASCGCPLKVDIQEDLIRLSCSSCGWERLVTNQAND